ncbi:MAG: DEAD/DEAH box helicase, partial [Spirochaetaceae bacterium]|nr:DEAD/DEAH box helicase [Spirochaetaceae bacterium]
LLGGKNIPLKDAAKKTGGIDVLKAPTALSNYLPEIRKLLVRPSVPLGEARLAAFLDEASELLARLGIEVILPKNLHRELKPRLVLSAEQNKAGGALVSYLDLPSLLTFEWRVAIGDQTLSAAEFNALVRQKSKVVRFKDKFIRIDPDELAALFKAASRPAGRALGANEFLKAHLSGGAALSPSAQALLDKVFDKKDFPPPPGLCAELRPYQLRGCNWALSLLYAGFDCIIADDMGLGKTIQAIAVLLRLKADGLCGGGKRSLVVAPAALLENWERELRRFAPSVSVRRYHGKERALADGAEVFLTTYQTAVRDKSVLCGEDFALLIVDEAHLLKNARTRGSKTVKALQARFKVALSGTPVENRLEDMRSLFDLILPGYLGGAEQFRGEFRRPIEVMRDKDAARRLREITSPFLLRRLKTDKSIISDLPEKITTDEYAALEKEQAALYESVVKVNMEKLDRLSDNKEQAPARSALILQLLTSLKQICGHPRVYDKESPALSRLSGKATLLLTLLQEILDGGERVLIFSQYVETLECLAAIIRNEAGEAAPLYHGGMSQAKRAAVVDAFQNGGGANILLVSLRAGGLGLNLTAASRVIHYDLWYNPAVEAQATDRAFRIGQKRNVFVHRLITKNSFEERIDAMLKSKKELADMTVGTGESWLASMSPSELRALFSR